MLKTLEKHGKVVELELGDTVTHEDYQRMIPMLEETIKESGALRCLISMPEIKNIEPRAILDELEFDIRHARDIERCAVVTNSEVLTRGTELWSQLMPEAEIKCFPTKQRKQAETWIHS